MQCFVCSSDLVPAFPRDTNYQFDNAMWITFDGGCNMFVDPWFTERAETAREACENNGPWGEQHPLRVVICHECSHRLCDTVPWIAELLDPHNSHAHTQEFWEAHPEHLGWDRDSID